MDNDSAQQEHPGLPDRARADHGRTARAHVREGRVWALTAVLAVQSAAMGVALWSPGLLGAPGIAGALLLAVGFVLADLLTVTVKHRGDSRTFSFSELPLVFGLVLFPPPLFLAAQCAGLCSVLVLYRRQPPMRVAFNLAQTACCSAIAIFALRSLAGTSPEAGARLWMATVASVLCGALLNGTLVTLAASLADGRSHVRELRRVLGYELTAAFTAAAFGILLLHSALTSPLIAAFAVLPLIGTAAAYRGYVREQVARSGIEFLYETTKSLHRSPQFETALSDGLNRAREMFRSEQARIWLARPDRARWLEIRAGAPADPDGSGPAWVPPGESGVVVGRRHHVPGAEALLRQIDAESAMAAHLQGAGVPLGVLVVTGKRDGFAEYDRSDLHLFDLLASQIAIGLENGQLERSLLEVTVLEEEMRYRATHDVLTGLANRAGLEERVAARTETMAAVLLIDLDDFKTVNDSLGHGAGDEVLRVAAHRLQLACREDDVVARLGGDEFAVLLANEPDRTKVVEIADRVAEALQHPATISNVEVAMGASVGVAIVARQDGSLEELLRSADVALYESKRRGKGRSTVFERGMDERARTRFELTSSLRVALDRDELGVAYQTVVDLRTGAVAGLEALLRWHHPVRGAIAPATFVSVAEESGLILRLGEWVLQEALAGLSEVDRELAGAGLPVPLFLNVNVAARQLQDSNLPALIGDALDRHGIASGRVTVEITETSVMRDQELAGARLRELRAMGVRVALDDFGTGYSSLSALHHLPIDVVKIDHSFVRMIADRSPAPEGTNGESTAGTPRLVAGIVRLADSLELDVIAEGIERRPQLEALRGLGCRYGQGYLFSRPVALPELLTHLRSARSHPGLTAEDVGAPSSRSHV